MSDCDEWQGSINRTGYGVVTIKAHRLAWITAHGAIPDGYDVHHTCHNRACVNLEHLQLVAHDEHAKLDLSDTCRRCGGSNWIDRMKLGKRTRECRDCMQRRWKERK